LWVTDQVVVLALHAPLLEDEELLDEVTGLEDDVLRDEEMRDEEWRSWVEEKRT
jgi:hypothetical protein